MASAILLSGGLDSAVLLADEAVRGTVQPIYVNVGLAWEAAERQAVRQFVDWLAQRVEHTGKGDSVLPLIALNVDMRDVYPATHWARTGNPPAYDTPDEDVYLHGRNISLISKAAVYAATRNISRIALAPLAGNPFPDASRAFLSAFSSALGLGLNAPVEIVTPFSEMHKEDVIKLGAGLKVPFELTLSCMKPVSATHCGLCSKCRERRDAFAAAGISDPTVYANPSPR